MARFVTHGGDVSLPTDHDNTPTNGQTGQGKRKSGRRSWFSEKPTRFEIAVEPSISDNLENEVEYLELTHFSKQPKIDFGRLKVGKSIARTLIVHNPHDYEQLVVVEKFPTKKNFSLDLVEFTVEADACVNLTMLWQPEDAMRCREMVVFKVDDAYRLQAILLGNADQPQKIRKGRGMSMLQRGRKAGPLNKSNLGNSIRQVLGEKSLNHYTTETSIVEQKSKHSNWNQVETKLTVNEMCVNTAITQQCQRLTPEDPALDELADTPTRRATFVKNDPQLLDTPGRRTTFQKDDPSLPDTPLRRTTFQKDEPAISDIPGSPFQSSHAGSPNTSQRRTTFQKDDPNLPDTPARRETFLKQFPTFRHGENALNDLQGAARRLSCIVGDNEDDDEYLEDMVELPMNRSNLRRSLTYTKLNVSRSPQPQSHGSPASPDYQHEKPLTPEICEPESVKNLSPASSQYFTPLTTPMETPYGSDSDSEAGDFHDSVMYLAGLDPMTPDAGQVTMIKSSLCEIHEEETEVKYYEEVNYVCEVREEVEYIVVQEDVLVEKLDFESLAGKNTSTPQVISRQIHHQVDCTDYKMAGVSTFMSNTCNTNSIDSLEGGSPVNHNISTEAGCVSPSTDNASPDMGTDSQNVNNHSAEINDCNNKSPELIIPGMHQQQTEYNDSVVCENQLLVLQVQSPAPVVFSPQESPQNAVLEYKTDNHLEDSDQPRVEKSLPNVNDGQDRSPRMMLEEESFSHQHVIDQLESVKVGLQQRLSSTPLAAPQRSLHCGSDSLRPVQRPTVLTQTPRASPIVRQQCNQETTVKSKPSVLLSTEANLDVCVSETQNSKTSSLPIRNSRERETKRQLFSKAMQQRTVIRASTQQRDSSPHDMTSTEPVSPHCHQHDSQHSTLRASLLQQAGELSPKQLPLHRGVPLLLKHDVSPLGKKRPLSADRQSALSRLTAPTESSSKRAKNEKTTKAPSSVAVHKPATSMGDGDRKMTRTMMLRRQVALNSGNKSDPKAKKCSTRKSPNAASKKPSNLSGKPTTNASGNKKQITDTSIIKKPTADSSIIKKPTADSSIIKKPSTNTSIIKKPMKGVAQSKLTLLRSNKTTALPKHPLPFAAKNVYYDERWMEKQEKGFTLWLNFILTPPEEFNGLSNTPRQKVDAGKLCIDVMSRETVPLAPTKEVLSFKAYSARRRMNRLRRSACMLYQSDSLIKIIDKLEREVELNRIRIRKDRKIHADLGIKQKLLDMLLCYNPLWLRVGMETIYGELIPMHSNMDIMALSKFIVTRLLGNPDIAHKFAHPTVPHLYRDGYHEELGKFILKKFLLLVLLLDRAKRSRLIDHDPCLFCKEAEFKSSRDLLLTFSKDYLSGEGDLTKHLSYFGYTVSHSQTALEEFDFSVSNLAVDLRCGLRLTRVMELLTLRWELSQQLRVPAVSRLQKVHNVNLALKTLTDRGIALKTSRGDEIDARNVVDGHREKSLQLLWLIIFNFQIEMLINVQQLQEEILFLTKNLRYKKKLSKLLQEVESCGTPDSRTSMDPDMYIRSQCQSLLLKWCRAVCAHYGLKIDNFTVSFSDGRALCCLLHHYHPSLLPMGQVNMDTTLTYQESNGSHGDGFDSDDEFSCWNKDFSQSTIKPGIFESLLANEKENFKLLYQGLVELGGIPIMIKSMDMSNTIPDEKVVITFVMYMCARLLDLRQEVRAARIIQAAWRQHWLRRKTNIVQHQTEAACIIQRAVRQFLGRRTLARSQQAALVLQRVWRCHHAKQIVRRLRQQAVLQRQHTAALYIQRAVRRFLKKRHEQRFSEAAVMVQSVWRGRSARHHIATLHTAATTIQQVYRAWRLTRTDRHNYVIVRQSVVVIQRIFRKFLDRRLSKQHKAANQIQSLFRMYQQRKYYRSLREKATVISSYFRMLTQRRIFRMKMNAACVVQRRWRATLQARRERESFLRLKSAVRIVENCYHNKIMRRNKKQASAAVCIQAWYKCVRARRQYLAKRSAAIILQRQYRSKMAAKQLLHSYHVTREAVIVIQTWVRRFLVHQQMVRQQSAALVIQTAMRRYHCRRQFVQKQQACVMMQRWWRGLMEVRRIQAGYLSMKSSVVKIQAIYRMNCARSEFVRMKTAATLIQASYRMYAARKQFCQQKKAVTSLQRRFRAKKLCHDAMEKYQNTRRATLVIQSAFRGYMVRKSVKRLKAAICIQASWKAHRQHQQYIEMKNAACMIQQWLCMLRQRKQYLRMGEAAMIIQIRWRATLVARSRHYDYLEMRQAVVSLQAATRGWIQRRQYLKHRQAIICLQAAIRGVMSRRRINKMKKAACTIQRYYRAQRLMKKSQEEYSVMRRAAVIIQSIWKCYQERKQYNKLRSAAVKIQSLTRMHLQQKQYQCLRHSVMIIQVRWRATLLARQQVTIYNVTMGAAITIQAAVRSWLQRRVFVKTSRAVVSIQAAVRGYLTRRRISKMNDAAATIQAVYRAHLAMKVARTEYQMMKNACVLIQSLVRRKIAQKELAGHKAARRLQSWVRMCQAKTAFDVQKKSAIQIQSVWRKYVNMRDYSAKVKAIRTLQKHCRATLAMRTARGEYRLKYNAVVCIQAAFRSHQKVREYHCIRRGFTKLQAVVRGKLIQRRFQAMQTAARVIQARYRACLAGRAALRSYHVQRGAAITIQSAMRGTLARRYAHYLRTVVCVQKQWRMILARRQFLRQKSAVVVLQSHLRQILVRREYLRKRNAAIFIQRWLRHTQLARGIRRYYMIMIGAAVTIQSAYRGRLARRYVQQITAAVVLQKQWRMHTTRKQFVEMKSAAVVLQSYAQMMIQRQYYKKLQRAAICIQQHWRAILIGRQYMQDLMMAHRAAMTVQATYRGYWQRQRYLVMKGGITQFQAVVRCKKQRRHYLALREATIVIQSHQRRSMAQVLFQQQKQAALTIQRRFRATVLMRKERQNYCMLKESIVKLQAIFRQKKQREEFTEKKRMVIVLQSHFRRRIAQRSFQTQKRAALLIQTRFRATLLMRKKRQEYCSMRDGFIQMQAVVRRNNQQKIYQGMKHAVTILQCYLRKTIAQKLFQRKRHAALVIQRKFRATKLARREALKYCVLREGFIKLQACFRQSIQRKNYLLQKRAITVLQSHTRRWIAQKSFCQLRDSALVVQSRFRANLLMRKQKEEYCVLRHGFILLQAIVRRNSELRLYKAKLCALTILQSHVRRWIVQKSFQEQREAAIVIQRRFRANLMMKIEQENYSLMSRAAVCIQATYRAHKQRLIYRRIICGITAVQATVRSHQQRNKYNKLRSAVSACQKLYRAKLQGREVRTQYKKTTEAVIRIQSLLKMVVQRRKFIRHRQCIVQVQAQVRGFLSRRRQEKILASTVCIQRRLKATLLMRKMRNQYFMMIGAAIMIQAAYKGHAERKKYLAMRAGIVRLQAVVRGRQQLNLYNKMSRAVCLVQRQFRVYRKRRSFRMEYERTCSATLTLQAYFRGYLVRRDLRQKLAAVCIQRNWRMHVQRKRFCCLKDAALVLQKNFRQKTCLQQYQAKRNAALTLQKHFRAAVESQKLRNEFILKKHAAIRIQSHYRGYRQRSEFMSLRSRLVTVQRICRGWVERRRHLVRIQRHKAALVIQKVYRRHAEVQKQQVLKEKRAVYLRRYTHVIQRHLSVIYIQRVWRRQRVLRTGKQQLESVLLIQNWLRARMQRLRYLRLVTGLKTLQTAARVYLARRQVAAQVIQGTVRKWLQKQQEQRKHEAATKIQSLWRGHVLRRNSKDKKISAARKRVEKATENATEAGKLCNRTRSALDYLLHCKQLALVLEAVMNLDVATRLSPVCCEWMVAEEAQCVLYQLIRGCNRSLPHMEIIKYTINIFLNLAKYVKTRVAVYEVEDSVDTLVDLMTIYREKGPIFTKTCTLLGIMCNDPVRRREVQAMPKVVEKLQSIHALTVRKHKMNESRAITQSKMKASKALGPVTPSKTHRLRPAWCARRDSLHHIENPLQAINFAMANLRLNAK